MYLLDANVFIQAKNLHYRFSTFPCFWIWMEEARSLGHIASVSSIRSELITGKDELADWAKSANGEWFLDESDEETQKHYAAVANWVSGSGFKPQAVASFLSGADPWLIAKAKTADAVVVTHEKSEPGCKKRVPIPDVCQFFGVRCIDTFDLLEVLRARF